MAKKRTTKRVSRRSKTKRRAKNTRRGKVNKFHVAMMRLKRMNAGQQREALKMSNNTFIRQMCAQVKKLRNASLSPAIQKRMKRQKKNLRKLVLPRTSIQVKRKMLTQRGGLFPLLMAALPSVVSALGSLIFRSNSKHNR